MSDASQQSVVTNELFPTEKITLPSHGYLYDDIPNGEVEIRPLTTKEERILSGAKGNALLAFNQLLSRCIVSPKIDPLQLLISDRFFIFIAIRWLTYGDLYSFNIGCPSCSTKFRYELDIKTQFKITNLEPGSKEPVEVVLGYSNIKVGLRQLRGFDEESISNYTKDQLRKKKSSNDIGDVAYEYRIAKHIVTIDGKKVDFTTALTFVENMHGKDSSSIKSALEDNASGVDPDFNVHCPSCSNEFLMSMPLNPEFFRS